jgi:hypothetical protein
MKRILVFGVIGPLLGVFAAWLNDVIAGRGFGHPSDFGEGGVMAFGFSVLVSLATMPIDAALSLFAPALLRALASALAGAGISVALILALAGKALAIGAVMPFAISGGLCMGTCSLLAHNYFGDTVRSSNN